jgi:hypothetical protein
VTDEKFRGLKERGARLPGVSGRPNDNDPALFEVIDAFLKGDETRRTKPDNCELLSDGERANLLRLRVVAAEMTKEIIDNEALKDVEKRMSEAEAEAKKGLMVGWWKDHIESLKKRRADLLKLKALAEEIIKAAPAH